MTYMINMEAKAVVWIAKKIRQEHLNVVNWLNESTDKDFYLIQLESYQIDDSNPAPFLKVICKPSCEMQEVGKQKKELSETGKLKKDFWEKFLEKAKTKTSFFSNDKPHTWTERHNKVGTRAIKLGCWVNANRTAVSVLFNPDLKDLFSKLKQPLEAEIGFLLEEKDKSKSRGFAKSNKEGLIKWFENGGYRSPKNEWGQIQEEMIDRFVKLEKSLKSALDRRPL